MRLRDAAEFHENSHTPDLAEVCDTLDDHIAQAVVELWPRKWDVELRPRITRFTSLIVHAVLKEGRELGVVDVRRMEGRELMARVIAEIIEAPHVRLMARCADFVFELGVQGGLSQTEMAALEGVEKATASHYCVLLKESHRGGTPAAGMKSKAAVGTYQQLRLGRSSRPPRMEWPGAGIFQKNYARQAR